MKLIVNIDRNGGIGRNGELLVHIKEDMKRFKELTVGNTVVMGRKTLESLPGGKPLPGRINVVLTRNVDYRADGVRICHSVEEIIGLDGEVFVIGGGEIYAQLLDFCDTAYITCTDIDGDADAFMPKLDNSWKLQECEQKNGYRFEKYTRKVK